MSTDVPTFDEVSSYLGRACIEHDDHTCYDCEQQLLHSEGVLGTPMEAISCCSG